MKVFIDSLMKPGAFGGLGDICIDIAVINYLHEQNYQIDVGSQDPKIMQTLLIEDIPFVKLVKKPSTNYDKIFIKPRIAEFRNKKGKFRPLHRFNFFNIPYHPKYCFIDLNWYHKFYKNFNFNKNSILINCQSSNETRMRSYPYQNELVNKFQKEGYDVKIFDFKKDVRENLFLIDQVNDILTVDTSTYWFALFLKKKPIVMLTDLPNAKAGLNAQNIIIMNDPDYIFDKFQQEKLRNNLKSL